MGFDGGVGGGKEDKTKFKVKRDSAKWKRGAGKREEELIVEKRRQQEEAARPDCARGKYVCIKT